MCVCVCVCVQRAYTSVCVQGVYTLCEYECEVCVCVCVQLCAVCLHSSGVCEDKRRCGVRGGRVDE